jgi:hypothetical protein
MQTSLIIGGILHIMVSNSAGGLLVDFIPEVENALNNQAYVEISGYCHSACTMWLAAATCVHPGTTFGFHAPYNANTLEGETDPNHDWAESVLIWAYDLASPALTDFYLEHASHLGPYDAIYTSAENLHAAGVVELCD